MNADSPAPSRESQLEAALGQWLHDFGNNNELSQRSRILLGRPAVDSRIDHSNKTLHEALFLSNSTAAFATGVIALAAQHWLNLQLEIPIQWEGGLDAAMLAACTEIRRLHAIEVIAKAYLAAREPLGDQAFEQYDALYHAIYPPKTLAQRLDEDEPGAEKLCQSVADVPLEAGTNSPLAQAVLDRVVGTNLAEFFTSAVDHLEKDGNYASAETELTNGVRILLSMSRLGDVSTAVAHAAKCAVICGGWSTGIHKEGCPAKILGSEGAGN